MLQGKAADRCTHWVGNVRAGQLAFNTPPWPDWNWTHFHWGEQRTSVLLIFYSGSFSPYSPIPSTLLDGEEGKGLWNLPVAVIVGPYVSQPSSSLLQLSFQEYAPFPTVPPQWHLVGGGFMSLLSLWVGAGYLARGLWASRGWNCCLGPFWPPHEWRGNIGLQFLLKLLLSAPDPHARTSQGSACVHQTWHPSQLLEWPGIGSHRHWVSHSVCPAALDDGLTMSPMASPYMLT